MKNMDMKHRLENGTAATAGHHIPDQYPIPSPPPPSQTPRLSSPNRLLLSFLMVLAFPIASMMGLLASTFFSTWVSCSAEPPTVAKT